SRMPQVNAMLQEKISEIISQKIEVPFDFFITLTKVDCSPDLKNAQVFVSVLPIAKETEALKFLNNRHRDIQKFMSRNWRLKFLPMLTFVGDETEEFAHNIYNTLDNLEI
ncbi:MAG: ribosome-binding factor A, partial [Patescibacteria group bacterium]